MLAYVVRIPYLLIKFGSAKVVNSSCYHTCNSAAFVCCCRAQFLARRQTKAKRRLIQAQREFKELKATARMQEDAASESYSIGGTELSAGISLQEPARNTRSHRRVVSDGMDASQHSAMMMQVDMWPVRCCCASKVLVVSMLLPLS